MRFAIVPFALALSAVAGAQQMRAPVTTTARPSVPPPIVVPFPPVMAPPAGGLATPVPFTPHDPTRPARDLYRVPDGAPFRSRPHALRGLGGAYFGPFYGTAVPETAPGPASPAPAFGMLRFDVTPTSAQVFVDSYYSGTVADLDDRRVLTLAAGPHRIELRAPHYEPVAFDVRIDPNDTIVYRAALEEVRPPAPVEPRAAGPSRMYVIPGCYAGNVPPRADRLPAGCSITQVSNR